jgi:hypothetical protein
MSQHQPPPRSDKDMQTLLTHELANLNDNIEALHKLSKSTALETSYYRTAQSLHLAAIRRGINLLVFILGIIMIFTIASSTAILFYLMYVIPRLLNEIRASIISIIN